MGATDVTEQESRSRDASARPPSEGGSPKDWGLSKEEGRSPQDDVVQDKQEQPKVQKGIPQRRFTAVSINATEELKPVRSLESREMMQLTQESLEALWKEMAESFKDDAKLYELVADKRVELKNNNLFHIEVPNLFFDSQLKAHQTRILGFLREKTGNEALLFKAVVVVEQVERKAYLPSEKFDELVKVNPAILSLRKLFPDIDF